VGTIATSKEIASSLFDNKRRNTMQGNFFTARWNNVITIIFGIVALIYILISLIAGVSIGSFIGLVAIIGST
jgi:tetrahydromethanopterin S-methyltransferase subunit E